MNKVIRLTEEEMKYIAFFETLTRVVVKDCVIDHERNRIIFVVERGQVGAAVGKEGRNVKLLQQLTGKNIEVIEYADTPKELIKNCLYPAKVTNVELTRYRDGRIVARVTVPPQEKGLAIGKHARNISRASILAKRYFGIDKVIIE